MRKLLFIFALLAAFVACSDDDDPEVELIRNLVVPQGVQASGQEVILVGSGFTKESKIQLRAEGSDKALDAEVVKVTSGSLIFKSPEGLEGKYTVILVQDGESHELGTVNFAVAIIVGEGSSACAVTFDEDAMKVSICKVDVSGQTIGSTLFTLDTEMEPEGIVADNNGKIYCKIITFDASYHSHYELHYFDTKTNQGGVIDWSNVDNCFAIGTDGEKLFALRSEKGVDKISLVSLTLDGQETVVHTYTNKLGMSYSKLYALDGTFVYGTDYAYCGLNVDKGNETSLHGFGFSLKEDNVAKIYADQNATFSYTRIGDTWYEFMCVPPVDEEAAGAKYTTTVYSFADEAAWRNGGAAPTAVAQFDYEFADVYYDPVSLLVYGFSDSGESIISFNPQDNTVFGKWVQTGCVGLFIMPE